MVECLNCGLRRELPEHECERCSYLGWMVVQPPQNVTYLPPRVEPAATVVLRRRLHAV